MKAVAELQRLLSIAIKRQCLSDVPLRAFLSGRSIATGVALVRAASQSAGSHLHHRFRKAHLMNGRSARLPLISALH